jgi:hypothetical protein
VAQPLERFPRGVLQRCCLVSSPQRDFSHGRGRRGDRGCGQHLDHRLLLSLCQTTQQGQRGLRGLHTRRAACLDAEDIQPLAQALTESCDILTALRRCLFHLVRKLCHIGSIQQERARRAQDGLGALQGFLPRGGTGEGLGA